VGLPKSVCRTSSEDPERQEKLQQYVDLCYAVARCEEEKEKLIRGADSAVKYLERQLAHIDTQLEGWANADDTSVEDGLRLEASFVRQQVAKQLASTRVAQHHVRGGVLDEPDGPSDGVCVCYRFMMYKSAIQLRLL
jgi:hypothetical protein